MNGSAAMTDRPMARAQRARRGVSQLKSSKLMREMFLDDRTAFGRGAFPAGAIPSDCHASVEVPHNALTAVLRAPRFASSGEYRC